MGFLIINDTVNSKPKAKKIERSDYNFSRTEGNNIWSCCVVTSNSTIGDISTHIDYHAYYRKEKYENINRPFKSKMEIAKEFISNFKSPSKCEKYMF